MNTRVQKFIFGLVAVVAMAGISPFASASEDVAIAGAEVGKWTMDYEAAKKLAAEKKLPMVLNFTGSDWCHWCKIMDKNVFAGEAWKEYASDNLVLVTLDFPRDKMAVPEEYAKRNAQMQQELGVRGYPTYIVLDSDAKTILGKLGAGQDKTPESFAEEVRRLTRFSQGRIDEFVKNHPDKEDDLRAALDEIKSVGEELNAWLATRPQRTDENMKKMQGFQTRMEEAQTAFDSFW